MQNEPRGPTPGSYANRHGTEGMFGGSAPHVASLEKWTPRAFLLAGVLFVGHAAVRGVEAFTTAPPPADVFGPAGYVVALVGLAGLYPALADRTAKLARLAAAVAGLPFAGWLVIEAWSVGEVAGIVPPQPDVFPGAFFVAVILTTLLAYVLFGVASLRAEVHSRTVAVLLLAPAAVLVLLIAGATVLDAGAAVGGVVVGIGQSLAHLALGGALRGGRARADTESPTDGVSAG